MPKHFKEQDIEKIKTLLSEGLNLKQISDHFPDRNHGAICRIARERSLSTPRNFWSKEDDTLLTEKILSGLSHVEAAKFFPDRTWIAVRRRANELKLKSNYHFRKWTSEDSFWDTPNEINCYWAGFIAADGCITRNGDKGLGHNLTIALNSIDREHLERFIYDCGSNNRIFDRYTLDKRSGKSHPFSAVHISNIKWKKPLEEIFNIFPCKTFTFKYPELPEKLMECWIAGYVDGDGTYGICKGYFKIGAVSAVKATVDRIFKFVYQFAKEKCKNKGAMPDGKKCFHFGVTGRQAIEASHHLMSLPCPHLRRKYNRVRDYLTSHPKYNLSLPPYDEHLASLAI